MTHFQLQRKEKIKKRKSISRKRKEKLVDLFFFAFLFFTIYAIVVWFISFSIRLTVARLRFICLMTNKSEKKVFRFAFLSLFLFFTSSHSISFSSIFTRVFPSLPRPLHKWKSFLFVRKLHLADNFRYIKPLLCLR